MKTYLLSLFLITVLTACGGGGGSSSGENLPVDPPVDIPDDGSKDGDDDSNDGDDNSNDGDDNSNDGDDDSNDGDDDSNVGDDDSNGGDDDSNDEPEENKVPVVSSPLEFNITEVDEAFVIDEQSLLSNASDENGDTLSVNSVEYISGDAKGMSISEDGLSISVDPTSYIAMGADDAIKVIYEYSINDGHGGSVDSLAIVNIAGLNTSPIVEGPIKIELSEFDPTLDLREEDLLAYATDIEGDVLTVSNVVLESEISVENFTEAWSDGKGMYIKPREIFNLVDEGDEEGVEYSFEVTDEHGAMTETSLIFNITGSDNVKIADMTFPDPVFKACVLDKAGDEYLYDVQIDRIICNELNNVDGPYIQSIEGVAQLKSLRELKISKSEMTSVDISQNHRLERLGFYVSDLTEIDLSNNPGLTYLDLDRNKISELDLKNNPLIKTLFLSNNELNSIDVSMLDNLRTLRLKYNNIVEIDVTNNTELYELLLGSNNLTEIDLSNNLGLYTLGLGGNQNLETLNVVNNENLTSIDISSTQVDDITGNLISAKISELNVSNNQKLSWLNISGTSLDELDLSALVSLVDLDMNNTNIADLDLQYNVNLQRLEAINAGLTSLDVSNNIALEYVYILENNLPEINFDNNPKMEDLYINVESLTVQAYEYLKDLEDSTSIDIHFYGKRP